MRSVTYTDGTIHLDLFTATGRAAIDVFGRIRHAHYGLATYTATYAETGRRLLTSAKVTSPAPLTSSREFAYPGTGTFSTPYDPVGRERARREIQDGDANAPTIESAYDALGRLQFATRRIPTQVLSHMQFTYEPLGNILQHTDHGPAGPGTTTLSYSSTDRDRICSVAFGSAIPDTPCNVKYDGVGNILEAPSRANGTRTLTYFPHGQVRTIADGSSQATFDYDAFGAVQQLVLQSTSSPDTRHDKHFGELIYQRDEMVNNTKKSVITRSIPGPSGLIATRHGPGAHDPWTFTFGDGRGNRFFTDHMGAFVQEVSYQPYGEVASASGAQPGAQQYTNAQWNGGDALAAFGLSQLGARLYDPVIGRFLSRDPLLIPRTAATTNPYAFANNDPVNQSDPTGLQPERDPISLPPHCDPGVCGTPPPVRWPSPQRPIPGRDKLKPQEPDTTTSSGGHRREPGDQIGPPWAPPQSPTLADNPLFTQYGNSDLYHLSPMGRELFGSFLQTRYGSRPDFDRVIFQVDSILEVKAEAVTDCSSGVICKITLDKVRFWDSKTSLYKMSILVHELVHALQNDKLGHYDMYVRQMQEHWVWYGNVNAIYTPPRWAWSMIYQRSGVWVVHPSLTLEQSADIAARGFYWEQQIQAGNVDFRYTDPRDEYPVRVR
jgi:RHS repeat-associated protein